MWTPQAPSVHSGQVALSLDFYPSWLALWDHGLYYKASAGIINRRSAGHATNGEEYGFITQQISA
jgi:hypothetical protein